MENVNDVIKLGEDTQKQMSINNLYLTIFDLQKQLFELKNQILAKDELIAKTAPEWKFDPKTSSYKKEKENAN